MKKMLVLAACLAALASARAADYYWSGAEGDDDGTKPGNWIDENGNTMTVAPGVDDALIVTSAVTQIVYPVATTGNMTQFRKILLAGNVTGTVDFKLGLGGSGVPPSCMWRIRAPRSSAVSICRAETSIPI